MKNLKDQKKIYNIKLMTDIYKYLSNDLNICDINTQCYFIGLIILLLKSMDYTYIMYYVLSDKEDISDENKKIIILIKKCYSVYKDDYFNKEFSFIDNINNNKSIFKLIEIINGYYYANNFKVDLLEDIIEILLVISDKNYDYNYNLIPNWISKYIHDIIMNNIDDKTKKLSVYFPCYELGYLIKPFENYKNLSLYCEEKNYKMHIILKLNSIINDIEMKIDMKDFFNSDLCKYDISIIRIPFNRFTTIKFNFKYLLNQISCLKQGGYGCAIIHTVALFNRYHSKQLKRDVFNKIDIIKIINLGDKIFKKHYSNISILFYRKNSRELENLTISNQNILLADFTENNNEYKNLLSGNELTDTGKIYLKNLIKDDKYYIKKNITSDSHWCDNIKDKNYMYKETINSFLLLEFKRILDEKYENYKNYLSTNIDNIIMENKFNIISLGDIFEFCPSENKDIYTVENCSNLYNIKFIDSTIKNNGVVGYVEKAEFIASEEKPLYSVSRNNSSIGTIFEHKYPFSTSKNILVFKLKDNKKYNFKYISSYLNTKYSNISLLSSSVFLSEKIMSSYSKNIEKFMRYLYNIDENDTLINIPVASDSFELITFKEIFTKITNSEIISDNIDSKRLFILSNIYRSKYYNLKRINNIDNIHPNISIYKINDEYNTEENIKILEYQFNNNIQFLEGIDMHNRDNINLYVCKTFMKIKFKDNIMTDEILDTGKKISM